MGEEAMNYGRHLPCGSLMPATLEWAEEPIQRLGLSEDEKSLLYTIMLRLPDTDWSFLSRRRYYEAVAAALEASTL